MFRSLFARQSRAKFTVAIAICVLAAVYCVVLVELMEGQFSMKDQAVTDDPKLPKTKESDVSKFPSKSTRQSLKDIHNMQTRKIYDNHHELTATSSSRIPRFIWGIASTNHAKEAERRYVIRTTYLKYYLRNGDNVDRICALNHLLTAGKIEQPERCQLAYAFFVGASPKGPTELVSWNESYPIVVDGLPISDSSQNEDDVVRLNIRENQFEGKMQTWFHYAAFLNQHYKLDMDYIVKADSDTLLYPAEFLNHTSYILPAPAEGVYSGKMNDPHRWEETKGAGDAKHFCKDRERQGKSCNPYIVGQIEILSADLAHYIGTPAVDRNALVIPDSEDMSIGEFVWSRPKPIHFIPIDNPLGVLWDHDAVRTKYIGQFRKLWFKYRQRKRLLETIDQNLPTFALVDVPSSGAKNLLFESHCQKLKRHDAISCFEKFEAHPSSGISKHIFGFVHSSAIVRARDSVVPFNDAVTFPVSQRRTIIERSSGLWVLRNPVERLGSFFFNEHGLFDMKSTEDFRACFSDIAAWAQTMASVRSVTLGGQNQSGSFAKISCPPEQFPKALEELKVYVSHLRRSRTALEGFSGDVFAIRYEHMRDDYIGIMSTHLKHSGDSLLSDGAQLLDSMKMARVATVKSLRKNVSEKSVIFEHFPGDVRRASCCILKEEIVAYRQLILDGVNLAWEAKASTLQSLAIQCGFPGMAELISSCD